MPLEEAPLSKPNERSPLSNAEGFLLLPSKPEDALPLSSNPKEALSFPSGVVAPRSLLPKLFTLSLSNEVELLPPASKPEGALLLPSKPVEPRSFNSKSPPRSPLENLLTL